MLRPRRAVNDALAVFSYRVFNYYSPMHELFGELDSIFTSDSIAADIAAAVMAIMDRAGTPDFKAWGQPMCWHRCLSPGMVSRNPVRRGNGMLGRGGSAT
jgi:hypothetical protein